MSSAARRSHLRPEDAHLQWLHRPLDGGQPEALALPQRAVDDAHVGDDALVRVVLGIEDERAQRRVDAAVRRANALHDGLQHVAGAGAFFGRRVQHLAFVEADDRRQLARHLGRVSIRQVDLVDNGDDRQVVVEGEVGMGECLRLYALRGVDDEEGAFAGRQRARDLVREVDVARRIDQIQLVLAAVGGVVEHADGLRLDGDALLALQVHRVQHLLLHGALRDGAGQLQQAVGEGRFSVVDVGDDAEVADVGLLHVRSMVA